MKEVAFFVAEKIATLEQVQGTVTHFVFRTYKQDGDILFEKERSETPASVAVVILCLDKFVAENVRNIPPSGIRKFFDLVLEMEGVISLGVGEPDFVTPWHIREACIYSLEKGFTTYTSNLGLLELRELISKSYKKDYNVDYNPRNQILVTTGVSEAADLAFRAIINPGDEVIVPEPSYVSYKPSVSLAGGNTRSCHDEQGE